MFIKKALFVAACFSAVVLTSCDEDSPTGPQTPPKDKPSLIGSWKYQDDTSSGTKVSTIMKLSLPDTMRTIMTITQMVNGKDTIKGDDLNKKLLEMGSKNPDTTFGKWKTNDDMLICTTLDNKPTSNTPYTLTNNTLTLYLFGDLAKSIYTRL